MNPENPLNPDATPNVPVEAPVQPIEQAPPAPAPVVQQDPAAPAPIAQEPAPAPVVEEEEDYSFDPIPTFNLPQRPVAQPEYQQPQQYQQPTQQPAQQAPTPAQGIAPLNPQDYADQYGNVDMARFAQAMAARDAQMTQQIAQQVSQQVMQNVLPQAAQISAQQMMAARSEERAWTKAEEKYPELKSNKELRDLVHKQRLSVIQGGGNESPLKSADRLFKYIGQARQEGQQQATESVRIQAAAHLESADNTASPTATANSDTYNRIGSKNKVEAAKARQSLIKGWMTEGKLDSL